MKLEHDKHLLTLSIYIFLTGAALIATTLGLINLPIVVKWIMHIITAFLTLLAPLIYGIIIAYLVDPIVEFYDKRCGTHKNIKWHVFKSHKNKHTHTQERLPLRTGATLLAFITILLIIGIFILIIVLNMKDMMGSTNIEGLKISFYKYTQYFEAMLTRLETSFASVPGMGEQTHLLQKIYGYFNQILTRFSNQLMHSITIIGVHTMNWLLAIVIAFYLLQDKRRALLFFKKVIASILKGK